MAPPSQLSIATSSVRRLLKEEASYHKELATEEAKIKELSDKIKNGEVDDQGNDPFILKQQETAAEQTRAVFGPLRRRIQDSIAKLEDQIALGEQNEAPTEELELAKETLKDGKASATNGAS